jgi:hypothetical protein
MPPILPRPTLRHRDRATVRHVCRDRLYRVAPRRQRARVASAAPNGQMSRLCTRAGDGVRRMLARVAQTPRRSASSMAAWISGTRMRQRERGTAAKATSSRRARSKSRSCLRCSQRRRSVMEPCLISVSGQVSSLRRCLISSRRRVSSGSTLRKRCSSWHVVDLRASGRAQPSCAETSLSWTSSNFRALCIGRRSPYRRCITSPVAIGPTPRGGLRSSSSPGA